MRIIFIFIINYNLKGEIKMGEIKNYFNEKLDTLVNNVNDNDYKNVLESDYSGNKEMNELKDLFKEKLEQAQNFKNSIEKVDQNIEMLYKAQENMNKNMDKNKQTSLQQAVLQEIDYFQNISKPSCLKTIGTLRGKLNELKTEVTSQEKKLDEIRKDNKKSTGKRILDFFGLSKTKDEATKKKEEENTQKKKALKQQLEYLKKEITNTSQKLRNSRNTLNNFKLVSKSAKDFQQSNFGIMTKKSVMNAIYNEKKGTGMIGCLSKVYKFLRQQYSIIILPKSNPNAFINATHPMSNHRKQKIKYDKTEIKRMKNMLTDKEPKHFMECMRKLSNFSKLVLDESLLNGQNTSTNQFDIVAFNKLKDNLTTDMKKMFQEIHDMIKEAAQNFNSEKSEQVAKKNLNTAAKEIRKKEKNLIEKYTNIKNQFVNNVKKLIPKIKNKDKLAQSLANLAFFNCIHSDNFENKYQVLFNEITVKEDIIDYYGGMEPHKFFALSWSPVLFVAMVGVIILLPIDVIPIITMLPLFVAVPLMWNTMRSTDKNDDLDAITGAIIEQSKVANTQ